MRYGYFDSEIVGTDQEGMPIFDRAETSDLFRLLLAKLVSNGVLASPGDCFQVIASEGLNVTVRPGFGMINGAFAYDDAENTLTLEKAPAQHSRIDRIVLRCNYADRLCELVVKTGTVAANPAPPAIVQPSAGDYYELGLATVLVGSTATVITQANITDTRLDPTVCGLITQLIDHLDTAALSAQLDQFYSEFVDKAETDYQQSRAQYLAMCQEIVDTLNTTKNTAESDFNTWFQSIRDKLSGDIAGSLQNQLDALAERVDGKTQFFSVTLSAQGWAEQRQSVAAPGVTAGNATHVFAAPAAESVEGYAAYLDCGVYCAEKGSGTLTFVCDSVPDMDLTVHVALFADGGSFAPPPGETEQLPDAEEGAF